MNQIGDFLKQFATSEVLTVLGTLLGIWIGWKSTKAVGGFTYNLVGGLIKNASFTGLAAATLLALGLGSVGFGVGEMKSRPKNDPSVQEINGLTNNDLLEMVKSEGENTEKIREVLKYAEVRDKTATVEQKAFPQKPLTKTLFKIEGGALVPVSLEEPIMRQTFDTIELGAVSDVSVKPQDSMISTPIAYMLVGLGAAASISGVAIFLKNKV